MSCALSSYANHSLKWENCFSQIEKLNQALTQNPEQEDLVSEMLNLADLGGHGLAEEEFSILDQDIEDLTYEINNEEIPLEETKQLEIHSNVPKKHRKKKHSRGFFKRTARSVAHAVRDTGRLIRSIGDFDSTSRKIEKIQLSSKSLKQKTTSEKVVRFVKKHKKALIIGSLIAAALITGAYFIATASASPAIGGTIVSTSGAIAESQIHSHPKQKKQTFSHFINDDCAINSVYFSLASEKAKENRYPGLIYSIDEISTAKTKADLAFNQFKSGLPNVIQGSDVMKIIELTMSAITTANCGPNKLGALSTITTTALAKDLVGPIGDRFQTLVQPMGEAYHRVYEMETANTNASLELCQKSGYEPKLEFHPDAHLESVDSVVFIDKNNPNPTNKISIVMP